MKTTNRKSYFFSKLYCLLFRHNYIISKKVTYHVNEYKCTQCNHELTINGKGDLIELSPKYREINDVLSRVHNKKKCLNRTIIRSKGFKKTRG